MTTFHTATQSTSLLNKITKLPEEDRNRFLKDLEATIALGIRALVLANIEKEDREVFERVVEKGDDAIVSYGESKIPDFSLKYFVLLDEIYEKALRSL